MNEVNGFSNFIMLAWFKGIEDTGVIHCLSLLEHCYLLNCHFYLKVKTNNIYAIQIRWKYWTMLNTENKVLEASNIIWVNNQINWKSLNQILRCSYFEYLEWNIENYIKFLGD